MSAHTVPPLVLDVSRLIWRTWTGRRPTGIDRVCAEYVERFAARSLAMAQRGKARVVLNAWASEYLFSVLMSPRQPLFRLKVVAVLVLGLFTRSNRQLYGRTYVNVGHTGLDNPSLWRWLKDCGLRAVILVHDLIPITHPELCRPGECDQHKQRMKSVAEYADGIIANSEYTLSVFEEFAATTTDQKAASIVSPLGVEPHTEIVSWITDPGPYFVVLGTIEARKRHAFLFEIWDELDARLGDRAPRLFVIGQRGWEADEAIAWLSRPDRNRDLVVEIGTASDADVTGYLSGARGLLMPSLEEGFGLPVAEALALGTPVLATDLPVYREFAGNLPIYLSAEDKAGWVSAIIEQVEDEAAHSSLRTSIAGYAPPTWSEHFAKVEPWLSRL